MSLFLLIVWACGETPTSELLLRAEQYRSAGEEEQALQLFRTLCEDRGVGDACGHAGEWRRGCDLDSISSCKGGMGRTMGTAWLDFARDACALGDADSCWQAGWEAAYGRSKADEGAVRIDFERGCRAGHALSCLAAADRLREDGDFAGAVMLYGQACAGHHEVGCDLAAHTRRLSESVAACTAGDIAACQWSCPRVSDDAICALALPATVDACDNRGGEACTLLGYIYGAGRGVEADPDRANALLWLGCDLDDPRACLRLEDNLSRRRGAPPSGSRAIPWLRNQVCDLQMDYGCAPHRFWE